MMRYMGGRMETVDFTHCKVKKTKSVKFEKEKKRRDIIKVHKIMSEPEDPTQISLFISHLPVSFGLHSAPPLSRSSKTYFALLPISLFPLISEPLHLISTFPFLYTLFLMIYISIPNIRILLISVNVSIILKNNIIVHRTKK